MAGNFPEGLTSRDRAHIYGEQYAPDAPKSERLTFADDRAIYFDYTVLPETRLTDFEVQVEVAGFTRLPPEGGLAHVYIDFEHVRTFKDAESAQDWVYSFFEEDMTYGQIREAIKRGN